MFSSDKNIETIGQLVKIAKENFKLQTEYLRLETVEKTVKLVTAISLGVIAFLVVIAILTYLSFAAAYALAAYVCLPVAFCIVAAFYVVLFILFLLFRKCLIEKPLVKFLTKLLMK